MAKLIQAHPVGVRQFTNKDQSKTYNLVYVTFPEDGTEGLACTSFFVTDQDFNEIRSMMFDAQYTIEIFKAGKFWDYIL